ncbi:hypothetical protein TNCT_574721 [Trichonephila clavata]|uniref:Uncharacterized protein n=1 Tax=Trichonephila clavata TaxID=2740835 RepID=A0A8X6FFP6_TRICU|nr:hypothetical protein TNCT_574721 [Trichonephila clavata]
MEIPLSKHTTQTHRDRPHLSFAIPIACHIWNHIRIKLGKVSSFDRIIKKRTSLFQLEHHRKMRNSRSIGSSLFHTTLRSKAIRYFTLPGKHTDATSRSTLPGKEIQRRRERGRGRHPLKI